MFGVLPRGFADEVLYGVMARYLAAFGEAREYLRGREARHGVNSSNPVGLHGLPFVLARGGYPAAMETFQRYVFDHSLVPYVLACLPGFEAAALIRHLLTKGAEQSDSRMMRHVFGRGSARMPVRLRFCQPCVRDDRIESDETVWKRPHQLPLTRVCWRHRCWLYEVLEAPRRAFIVRPTELRKANVRRLGRGRVSNLSLALALADKAMLDAGQTGFLGAEIRQAYLDLARDSTRVKAHGAAVAVEDVESARHKLLESGQRRVREDARDAWITPLLERANENEVFRCDEQLSVSHRHVLALTLADVSIEHLGAAARARLACDVSTDFDICGSVPCARHSVMWMSDLEARVNLFNVRVRACCSVCGFRAIASPGVKTIQLQSEGTTWLEAASELHRERILTDNEQAMHLGVTPRELERRWTAAYWRSREAHKHRVPYRVFAFTATQHDWRLLPTRT